MATQKQIETAKRNLTLVGIKGEFNRFPAPLTQRVDFSNFQLDPEKCKACPPKARAKCLEGQPDCLPSD